MVGGESIESANQALSGLVGLPLSQFAMWGYGLHLDIGSGYRITVETPLSVTGDGHAWVGEPATGDTAAALLRVLHTDVTSAKVVDDGGLRLETACAVIEVAAHESFESWQLSGPGRLLVVCAPGGDVVVFRGDGA